MRETSYGSQSLRHLCRELELGIIHFQLKLCFCSSKRGVDLMDYVISFRDFWLQEP